MTSAVTFNRQALQIYEDDKGALVKLEINDDKGTKKYATALPYDLAKELDQTYDRLIREAEQRREDGNWP